MRYNGVKYQKTEVTNEKYSEKIRQSNAVLVENVQKLRTQRGWSVRELSERADIPYDSLQSFLQRKSEGCNYITFVKLCYAFELEPSELSGVSFVDPKIKETVSLTRQLKQHHRDRIVAYAMRLYKMFQQEIPGVKEIAVLLPECKNGFLKASDHVEKLLLVNLDKSVVEETNVALKIPCWHYDPHYRKGEILLLGTHRAVLNGEPCVVYKGENMFICKKKIEYVNGNKEVSYVSLLDGHTELFKEKEITQKLGFVIGFLYSDGEWGIR